MPDIATVLKEEIARLARKELRRELDPLNKTIAQQRTEVAQLKRRLADLEKKLTTTERRRKVAEPLVQGHLPTGHFRFSVKGLQALRARLGLSATSFGVLVGASARAVHGWESGIARPQESQLAAIAALRGIGKREVAERILAAQSTI